MAQYVITTGDMQSPNLAHYGILRQKWGVRRFQYPDGRLTPAGKARYHKMIATNVQKDRMALARGDKRRTKYRSKIEKEIQEEFRQTPEGRRLEQANEKVGKIQRRMNTRDESYQDPKSGVMAKTVNRIGQNADKNRMADALAEQNEAQKAGARKLDEIRKEFSEDILDATIKDLKIYITDDGREFLEKYLRGDEDATFEKPSKKQERAEAKEVKEAKRQAAAEKEDKTSKVDKPEYIDKVETKDGDTRYIYDEDELKAYNENKSSKSKSSTSDHLIKDTGSKDRKSISDSERELGVAYANMLNKSKTAEEKDRKVASWNKARDNDLYSLDFLEAVQNVEILDKGDTTALLTEYAKFLDDPSDYWVNGRHKLKEASPQVQIGRF